MVELAPLPPLRRFVLRGDPAVASTILAAFGVTPPGLLRAATAGPRSALGLGPDEWWLLAEDDAAIAWPGEGAAALVEISAGRTGFVLEGAAVPLLLAEGCPLDLDGFAPGSCTRTLFGKVEILLWRRDPARWQIETARSLAPHLGAHLAEALADLGG